MSAPLLEIDDVSVVFDGFKALSNLTFNINQGNPAGLTVERFLTPNGRRAFRLVVRTTLGGPAPRSGRGGDID